MTQVVRLIWRLDYNVSYTYLDKRGAALNAMTNVVPEYWDIVADGTIHSSYVGTATRENLFRAISLEPNSLNGDMQWSSGANLNDVLRDSSFRGANSIVRELLTLCDIRTLARAGLRLFCVSKFADSKRNRETIFDQIDSGIRALAIRSLGPIEDVGITFEGRTPDNLGYRVTFGPFAEKNATGSLPNKPPTQEELKLLAASDLFFDIDLFETNFSFVEHSLFRWAETKVAKAIDFIAQYG